MIEQVVIAVCGTLSIWMSQATTLRSRKWACIIGMIAQPFWMYATIKAEQWGIFALTFVYTVGWARGIYGYWLK